MWGTGAETPHHLPKWSNIVQSNSFFNVPYTHLENLPYPYTHLEDLPCTHLEDLPYTHLEEKVELLFRRQNQLLGNLRILCLFLPIEIFACDRNIRISDARPLSLKLTPSPPTQTLTHRLTHSHSFTHILTLTHSHTYSLIHSLSGFI